MTHPPYSPRHICTGLQGRRCREKKAKNGNLKEKRGHISLTKISGRNSRNERQKRRCIYCIKNVCTILVMFNCSIMIKFRPRDLEDSPLNCPLCSRTAIRFCTNIVPNTENQMKMARTQQMSKRSYMMPALIPITEY